MEEGIEGSAQHKAGRITMLPGQPPQCYRDNHTSGILHVWRIHHSGLEGRKGALLFLRRGGGEARGEACGVLVQRPFSRPLSVNSATVMNSENLARTIEFYFLVLVWSNWDAGPGCSSIAYGFA